MPWSDWKWCVRRPCVPGSPSTTSPTFSSLQTSTLLSSWKLRSALMLDGWVLDLGPLAGDRVHQQPARDGRGGDRGLEADGGNPSTPHRRGVQGPRLPADSPDGSPEEEAEVGKVAPGFGHFRAQGPSLLCATNPAVVLNSQNKLSALLFLRCLNNQWTSPRNNPWREEDLFLVQPLCPTFAIITWLSVHFNQLVVVPKSTAVLVLCRLNTPNMFFIETERWWSWRDRNLRQQKMW